MKLKYLLASGLFLSTAFVACTNDDFAEISAPVNVNTDDAIALGEGYTINVSKGVDTRSAFDSKYTPYWEEGDRLGAAWVHMVTELDEDDNTKVADCIAFQSSDKFYSNHPFTLSEGAGTNNGSFTSPTNAFAGAYVLYYPYDETVAMTGEEIPVTIKSYETDCENSLKNISANMFSYSPAAFVPGGPQTGSFSLKQIPVLVRLQFAASKQLNHYLDGGITISNIVIEAKASGSTVLAKSGTLKPVSTVISALTADNYNGVNNKNLKGIVDYDKDEAAENIFVTVLNSDDPKYQIVKKTVAGQPDIEGITEGEFVFSMLPLSAKADEVTIKVVTDKGVFATTYDNSTTEGKEKLNLFNEAKKTGTADQTKGEQGGAAYEGGQVAMGVTLDVTVNDDVIYTVDEFMKRWEEAMGQKNNDPLVIGTPLTLTEALTCDDVTTEVEIKGAALTVPSVNLTHAANVNFNNDELIVKGDVYSSGDAPLTVKKLTAKNVNIEGKADIKAHNIQKLTVASDGNVTLAAYDGAASATTKEDKAVVKEIVINGNASNKGKLTLTPTDLAIEKMDGSNGTLTLNDDMENAKGATITLGSVTVSSGKKFTNNGTVNLNGPFNGMFENNAGAKLYINANTSRMTLTNAAADAVKGLAAAEVYIKEDVKLTADDTYTVTNKGTINVDGTLEEAANSKVIQTEDAARINVSETGAVTFAGTTGVAGGYVIVDAESAVTVGGATNYIAANVTAATTAINTNAAVYLMNGNFNSKNFSEGALSSNYASKKLVFTGGTITFDGTNNITMTSGTVEFAGNVTLSPATGVDNNCTFTLNGASNKVLASGGLTINNPIKIAGSGATLTVEKGAAYKNSSEETHEATITVE